MFLSYFTPSSFATLNNLKKFTDAKDISLHNGQAISLLKESTSSQFVIELSNGVVINEGGILTEDGYVLKTTQTCYAKNCEQHGLMKKNREINNEPYEYFDGKLAIISSPGSENWYHYLLQVLPRLIILDKSNISYDRIYINNLKFSWQKDSINSVLKHLNIPEDKLLLIDGDSILQAKTLIVPSVPFIPSKGVGMPKWLIKDLRYIFLDDQCPEVKTYDKIYISRAKASVRKITNELDLTTFLEAKGFNTVYLEELSTCQQAHLFNHAKIIIGPHGSGFSNLIFASKGCKLVEIDHGTTEARSYYGKMAELMLCKYAPFYVDQTTEEHLEDNMNVNINVFAQQIGLEQELCVSG